MFKKSIFIITTMMLCNTSWAQEEDNRWRAGDLMFNNTKALVTAYIAVNAITALEKVPEKDKTNLLWTLTGIAVVTTIGCVIVEGVNGIDHWINPINKTDPKLEAAIKKLAEQK